MVMKVYTPEFKADAVALYLSDPAHTYEGIGNDLGISRETLRNWLKIERRRKREQAGAGTERTDRDQVAGRATREELEAQLAELRTQLQTMRRENQKLSTERDILRQATKFFAQEMTW